MTDPLLAPPVQIIDYAVLRMVRPQTGTLAGLLAALHHVRADAAWEVLSGTQGPGHLTLRFTTDPLAAAAPLPLGARADVSILRPLLPCALRDNPPAPDRGGIWELRSQAAGNYDTAAAQQSIIAHDLPFAQAQGAEVQGLFATWFGSGMNRFVTLLHWPDMATMLRAAQVQQTDTAVLAQRDAQRHQHGRPLLRGTEVQLMRLLRAGPVSPD